WLDCAARVVGIEILAADIATAIPVATTPPATIGTAIPITTTKIAGAVAACERVTALCSATASLPVSGLLALSTFLATSLLTALTLLALTLLALAGLLLTLALALTALALLATIAAKSVKIFTQSLQPVESCFAARSSPLALIAATERLLSLAQLIVQTADGFA